MVKDKPKVMIILGSASDKDIAMKAVKILEKLQINYSVTVASAHRTHDKLREIVRYGTKNGIEVFIGIAGLAAHLPGAIASYTSRPVIGVPVDGSLDGLDALYSCVQMPYPTPVLTVGIGRGDNAAILAGQIIASYDEDTKKNISKLRKEYMKKVENGEKELLESLEGEYLDKDFLKEVDYERKELEESDDAVDVMILAGSHSDREIARNTAIHLDRANVTYELNYISPVRNIKTFEKFMNKNNNAKIFIAISGLSAIVAGSIVSLTEKPVIGVPCSKKLEGKDALLSMVNMPPGVPVGTVGIDNGRNAAIAAIEILSITNENYAKRLNNLRCKNGDL